MKKYVVVSNLPDNFLCEQMENEYKNYDEAVDAMLDCVGQASRDEEHLSEVNALIEKIHRANDINMGSAMAPHLHALNNNGPMMEYYVGNRVYRLYRQR